MVYSVVLTLSFYISGMKLEFFSFVALFIVLEH